MPNKKKRTNDPNRFTYQEGDLEVVEKKKPSKPTPTPKQPSKPTQ